MQFRPTRTGSDGTGYYRGADGKMYYGNPANGYLKETQESARQRAEAQKPSEPSAPLHLPTGKSYAMAPWEKALAAGTAGVVLLLFAALAVVGSFVAGAAAWGDLFTRAADCLHKDGLFTMLQLFWQLWVCLLGALFCLKGTVSARRVSWPVLAAVFLGANLLRELQRYPDRGIAGNFWNGALNGLLLALPVGLALWLLSRLLQKLR